MSEKTHALAEKLIRNFNDVKSEQIGRAHV